MSEATCIKQTGYVIFDSICLFLSAAEASLTAEVAEEIAEAAKPVLSKLGHYCCKRINYNRDWHSSIWHHFYYLEWWLLR